METGLRADPPAHAAKPALGRRALHGLAWMLAQNIVARCCGMASQLVLAALLGPAEFGLVGLANSVVSIAVPLTNVGIEDVALQRQRGLSLWLGPVFWISCGLAMLAALAVMLAAPFAARAYHAPGLAWLVVALALTFPLGALAAVPGLLLRVRLRFGTVAAYGAAEIIVQSVLTILCAWAGLGAASFVLPVPLLAAVKALVWWRLAPPGIRLRPHLRRWRHVLGSTAAVFTTRLLLALIAQGDYVVLGLLDGPRVVGPYYFGFRLAAQPLWLLAANFSSVLFPVLASLKDDPARQRQAVLNASTMLAACVMPLAVLEAALAGPLLRLMFGAKWAAAIPVVQLLSIGLAFDAVSWVAGALLFARGEYAVLMRSAAAQVPLFFVLVLAGAWADDAVGVAAAVSVFYAISQPVLVCLIYRRIAVGARQVLAIYAWPLAGALLAVGAAWGLALPLAGHDWLQPALVAALGPLFYAALLRHFAPALWRQFRDRLAQAMRHG